MRYLRVLFALGLTTALQGVDLPRKSPEFNIQMPGAKPVLLSQYKGKAVVMAFILSYCSHCQKAVACLTKDEAELGPRGLQVLGVIVDDPKQVPDFIRKFKPAFPVGYTTDTKAVLDFMQHPAAAVPHMPLIAFIDKNGMIRAQYEGDDPLLKEEVMEANLRKGIDDLLKGVVQKTVRPVTPKKAE
jgi:peroxiredoxin